MKQETYERGRERRERRRSLPWMKLRAGEAGLDETTTVRDLAEDAADHRPYHLQPVRDVVEGWGNYVSHASSSR